MVDRVSAEKRSKIMSSIRSGNTEPEMLLRKELFRLGYRYSLKHKIGDVRPDIALISRKAAIFVDGCFWHKCPKCYRPPASNLDYWLPKLERNVKRDKEHNRFLKNRGWFVIRVWEHDVRKDVGNVAGKISKKINGGK